MVSQYGAFAPSPVLVGQGTSSTPFICANSRPWKAAVPAKRALGTELFRPYSMSANTLPAPSTMQRRSALKLFALSLSSCFLPSGEALADTGYASYRGPLSLGFSFSYPNGWIVKKKPIRTHLSEVIVTSDKEPTTNAGLIVDNVKIDSIEKFGTPKMVGNKVIDVETKKDSVNSASVLSAESESKNGLTYYVLDYVVDSSRGEKRYLAKATITGGQLYVFTAQAKKDEFENETQDTLRKMLVSFTVVKQYL